MCVFTYLGELREMNMSHDASGKGRGKGHVRRKKKNSYWIIKYS